MVVSLNMFVFCNILAVEWFYHMTLDFMYVTI